MESQLKQITDPDVKKAMAQAIANHQLASILGKSAPASAPVASAPVETPADAVEQDDNLG